MFWYPEAIFFIFSEKKTNSKHTPPPQKKIIAHYDKSVRVYDMRTGNQEFCEQVHNATVTSVALSPCTLVSSFKFLIYPILLRIFRFKLFAHQLAR